MNDGCATTVYKAVSAAEYAALKRHGFGEWPTNKIFQTVFECVSDLDVARVGAEAYFDAPTTSAYVAEFTVGGDFFGGREYFPAGDGDARSWWISLEEIRELNNRILGPISIVEELEAPYQKKFGLYWHPSRAQRQRTVRKGFRAWFLCFVLLWISVPVVGMDSAWSALCFLVAFGLLAWAVALGVYALVFARSLSRGEFWLGCAPALILFGTMIALQRVPIPHGAPFVGVLVCLLLRYRERIDAWFGAWRQKR